MPLPFLPLKSSKPMTSHNFVVFVGAVPVPFSKVSSIEISIETEALQEGGENQFVHSLSKPVSAEKTLVCERGVDTKSGGAVLTLAANAVLKVGSVYSQIIICVLDQWAIPRKAYSAKGVILKKRRFSELNAMSGEVFVESLEFTYLNISEVAVAGMMYGATKTAKSLMQSSSPVPERFTPPLDPPPPAKPKPERFTPPLE